MSFIHSRLHARVGSDRDSKPLETDLNLGVIGTGTASDFDFGVSEGGYASDYPNLIAFTQQ